MRTLLLVIAVCITATALHAQKRPFKPGKIKMADLEMEYYPGDSTVNAAILYDYGYFNVEQVNFTRMRRIKIFTREGLGQLIFRAPVRSKGSFTGFVLNYVDGKIEKERISRDHI